ncbi:MAG: nuclear transport factor 2 family protein [Paracoccaceae bacterium]
MTDEDLIALVGIYFAAVDAQDLSTALGTLTEDCQFSVETHGVVFEGQEDIAGMLTRLWSAHRAVKHDNFTYVPNAARSAIATQFKVTNTLPDGGVVHKSNCNFFTARAGRFDTVAVYMAGENTLTRG